MQQIPFTKITVQKSQSDLTHAFFRGYPGKHALAFHFLLRNHRAAGDIPYGLVSLIHLASGTDHPFIGQGQGKNHAGKVLNAAKIPIHDKFECLKLTKESRLSDKIAFQIGKTDRGPAEWQGKNGNIFSFVI